MKKPSFVIGIDLGTTNSTLSYASIPSEAETDISPAVKLPIEQALEANLVGELFTLPSFIYFPLEEEQKQQYLPTWQTAPHFSIGKYAQNRGLEAPQRLISSAKSWLCHQYHDRREKCLPAELENDSLKISPVDACKEMLCHLKESWNAKMKDDPFNQQMILVTVPASFDPSARELVQEAAAQAGYPEMILIEEPLAAFYAWLSAHAADWRQRLKVGDSVLIVDIGGGTTDFSLIAVEENSGDLELKRQAVGAHLLLGGDNIDHALAFLVRQKLEDLGHEISPYQMQSLIHQCRKAKEELLAESSLTSVPITVLGRGSRLIGNTIQSDLTKEEVYQVVLDGFIPLLSAQEQSIVEKQAGLQDVGLPYAKDPRISCQLAKFLSMTADSNTDSMEHFKMPTAVLFNGGTLKSPLIRNRIMTLLKLWAETLGRQIPVELDGADYDFAVSLGAVYYGLIRQGKGIRVKSGTSRSYFIGVEETMPAVPGMAPPIKAVCIVPFGLEEGEERVLDTQEFALSVGEPATFRFFSRASPELSNGLKLDIGTVVRQWKQELTELHPIETTLDKNEGDGKAIYVKLKAKLTELGVLEVWCEAKDGRKWRLEFDARS